MSQPELRGSMHEINDVEFEDAMRRQNPQLKLLYALGIAQMIETEAATEIPPLVFEDNPNQHPTVDLERTDKMASLTLDHDYFNDGWILNPLPQRTPDGPFDTTLLIKATRATNQQVEKFANTFDLQSVSIAFTQEGHLQVVGGEITFDGDLAIINDQQLTHVQAAIKQAFSNPHTTSGVKQIIAQ